MSVLASVLFNMIINDVESGTECTLSKFSVDTKMIAEVDNTKMSDELMNKWKEGMLSEGI